MGLLLEAYNRPLRLPGSPGRRMRWRVATVLIALASFGHADRVAAAVASAPKPASASATPSSSPTTAPPPPAASGSAARASASAASPLPPAEPPALRRAGRRPADLRSEFARCQYQRDRPAKFQRDQADSDRQGAAPPVSEPRRKILDRRQRDERFLDFHRPGHRPGATGCDRNRRPVPSALLARHEMVCHRGQPAQSHRYLSLGWQPDRRRR